MAQVKLLTSIVTPKLKEQVFALDAFSLYTQACPKPNEDWISALERENADVAIIELVDFEKEDLQRLIATKKLISMDIILISDGEPNPYIDNAMRNGVSYHMRLPLDAEILQEFLSELHADLVETRAPAKEQVASELSQFGRLIGSSAAMRKLYRIVRKSSRTDASILVIGESGSGKELVANTLHLMSPRSDKPFVSINCGAISTELIESELFGHVKGAFTGATSDRVGVFEQAEGGTLFLDEITEMPMDHQVKLLRVLETGEFKAVGSDKLQVADVRIIAATNREPGVAIAEDLLREDLYFRIAHFPIRVPALREREDDITGLAKHFLAYRNAEEGLSKEITTQVLEKISAYHWPGNVRELLHAIERAYILADDVVGLEHLVLEGQETPTTISNDYSSLEDMEKQLILQTLEELDGNKSETAERLGISVKTLYNKLKKYEDFELE